MQDIVYGIWLLAVLLGTEVHSKFSLFGTNKNLFASNKKLI